MRTRTEAFAEIVRKARGGAVGVALGPVGTCLIAYTFDENQNYELNLIAGMIGGSVGGAVMSGTRFGIIGISVLVGLAIGIGGILMLTLLPTPTNRLAFTIVGTCVVLSFAIGCGIELYRAR
jgi:hypothetical protein